MGELLQGEITPALYQTILARAVTVIPGAEAGSILLRGADGRFRFVAAVDYDLEGLKPISLAESELYCSEELLQQRSLLIENPAQVNQARLEPDRHLLLEELADVSSIRAAIAVPIRFADKVVAIFTVECKRADTDFAPESQRLAETFGYQIGLVLQNLSLREAAEEQSRQLYLLDTVRTALARELDFGKLLQTVVRMIAETFAYACVSVYLKQAAAANLPDKLVLYAKHGDIDATGYQQPLSEGVMERVMRNAKAELIADVRADKDVLGSAAVVSALAVPLCNADAVVAVLKIEHDSALTKTDLSLMLRLSEQINLAVERASLHKKMLGNERKFRLLAENMRDVVVMRDAAGKLLYSSPSATALYGFSASELRQTSLKDFVLADDYCVVEASMKRFQGGDVSEPFEYRHRTKAGGYIWVETYVQPLYREDGSLRAIVSSTRDISSRKAAEAKLEHLVEHDSMTGLVNREAFVSRLKLVLEKKRLEPAHLSALLFIDLDRFKAVNDNMGHAVGDALLTELAKRFKENVRPGDTVARLGGDEFAVLLSDLPKNTEAKATAERLQAALRRPFHLLGHEVYSGASIGMAFVNNPADTAEDLLRNADLAMYAAKEAGGSDFAVFNTAMLTAHKKRMDLEGDLRRAIDENELFLTYQPLFDLSERKIAGFEALLRWKHPDLGLIPPDKFIPLAEASDLILDIDRWVLKEGCRQMVAWEKAYPRSARLFVSINLSTRHLMVTDAAAKLAGMIRVMGVEASRIKLEVTEGALLNNAEAGASVLASLRSEGIKIQLDDFGTGYSSLSYLHKLPLDSLKIDRSFVQRMDGGKQDEEIVKTILALGNGLGLQVVAEGIETAFQMERLTALGCTYGQGYLIAKPLMVADVESRYLAQERSAVLG